jgi:3-hydroxybutyryl-CoA dehydratase
MLPKIGEKRTSVVTYSTEKVETFAKLSGDENPIHLNEDFAKESLFGGRIVHGILVASQISALIANELPGPGSVYLNQELKFVNPVYHGDEITCIVEVIELKEDKNIIFLQTLCKNKNNMEVIIGKAIIKKV